MHSNVKESERGYLLKLSVYDRERLSSNESVGHVELPIQQLIDGFAANGLDAMKGDLLERELTLLEAGTNNPLPSTIHIRVNFRLYSELRREFWTKLCHTFDNERDGFINRFEFEAIMVGLKWWASLSFAMTRVDLL